MLSNFKFTEPLVFDNIYNIPVIEKQEFKFDVNKVMGFNYCLSKKELIENTIHFFLDDYQFERVWNKPERYLKILKEFNGCFSPDFSIFRDAPYPIQLFNVFRNRIVGLYWQRNGINVIPTVGWGDVDTWDFCFEGVEEGSWVAISTRGAIHRNEDKELFKEGYNQMLEVIKPEKIIVYGRKLEGLDGNIEWIPWDYYRTEKLNSEEN